MTEFITEKSHTSDTTSSSHPDLSPNHNNIKATVAVSTASGSQHPATAPDAAPGHGRRATAPHNSKT